MDSDTNHCTLPGHLAAGTSPGSCAARLAPREVVSATAILVFGVALWHVAMAEREAGRTIHLGRSSLSR
jgi:hypothetical protein